MQLRVLFEFISWNFCSFSLHKAGKKQSFREKQCAQETGTRTGTGPKLKPKSCHWASRLSGSPHRFGASKALSSFLRRRAKVSTFAASESVCFEPNEVLQRRQNASANENMKILIVREFRLCMIAHQVRFRVRALETVGAPVTQPTRNQLTRLMDDNGEELIFIICASCKLEAEATIYLPARPKCPTVKSQWPMVVGADSCTIDRPTDPAPLIRAQTARSPST